MKDLIESYGFLIVLLPLLGAAVNGLFGRRLQRGTERSSSAGLRAGPCFFRSSLPRGIRGCFRKPRRGDHQSCLHVLDAGTLTVEVAFLFDP